GMRLKGGRIKLGAEDVAQGVALETSANEAVVPVHVLADPIPVVGRLQAEVGPVTRVPGFGQVADGQAAFEHVQLELKAQHNMKVVGDFVGVGADERALDLVDGAVERVLRYIAELAGEGGLELRKVVVPEWAAAAD